jgi:multicomponent Na+:H+ antiporter subunit C
MNAALAYALAGVALFAIGLFGLVFYAHLLRKVLAVNIMASGVFLVLVTLPQHNGSDLPDPITRALVLTGIVVAVSSTALALALVRRVAATTGRTRLPGD